MKKKILIFAAFIGTVAVSSAQQGSGNSIIPTKSLTVQEANQLNGNARPIMKDGKLYSQWVAEERAKKQAQQKNVAGVQNPGIVSINAFDGKPAPAKAQPDDIKSENDNNLKPVIQKADASITKTEATPNPEVPEQFRLPATTPNWGGTPVADKQVVNRSTPVQVKSYPEQPADAKFVPVDAPKTKPAIEKGDGRKVEDAGNTKPAEFQKVKPAATQKDEVATQPALPAGLKLETGPTEVKPAEQKAEPASTQPSGNAPNAAKTKTN